MSEMIDVKLKVPKQVDDFMKKLDFGESDYQRILLDGIKAHLRAVLNEDELPYAGPITRLLDEAIDSIKLKTV